MKKYPYLNDLLVELIMEKPRSRPELVDITGLPRTTIFDYLKGLELDDILERFEKTRKTCGRRKAYWKFIE